MGQGMGTWGWWEISGGAAMAGEDSEDAIKSRNP